VQKNLITPDTKIADLLNDYPELEKVLIEASPLFIKLKNPVLRRTIAKVTSLKQAAAIGKVSLNELIIKCRQTAGQDVNTSFEEKREKQEKPLWLNTAKVKIEYDVREDLDSGIQPMNRVLKETATLGKGEIYLLITAFEPLPLIELLKNRNFEYYTEEKDGIFRTYFFKS